MRVLGVGYCTLDEIGMVERFPEPDCHAEMVKFSVQGGGVAATAMAVLARWGMNTRFVGKVGEDARGLQIERTLASEGVDTRAMIHDSSAISQLTFIVVEAGTGKKATYYTAGNVSVMEPEEIDAEAVLDDIDLLLVDGRYPRAQLMLMKAARAREIPVILEASANRSLMGDLIGSCDYLVATERFASQFTGVGNLAGLCRAMLKLGPRAVVVTLGNEGVVAMDADQQELLRLSAHPVTVVDSTGAGDVFLGAFVYGITQGWPLEKQVRFANVAAGFSCRDLGGRGAIPTLDEVGAV